MPRENGTDYTESPARAMGTSQPVIDVTKHEGLASLPGFRVIDAAGPNGLRRLWDAFALTDEQLAGVLGGRVHPAAGQWLASWDEPQS